MLDAYKYVLSQLCKNGLPKGNIFDYASYLVNIYEKKWKEKKSKMLKEKIDRYYEQKKKELNCTLEAEGEIRKVNKSLEHREEYKFIQKLDKSRSKRNIIPRITSTLSQENFLGFNRNNKNFKFLKEIKTNQERNHNNINIFNQIDMEKEHEQIRNNNIGNSNIKRQYNKNNSKKENIKIIDTENTNNDNKISTKKKKKSK